MNFQCPPQHLNGIVNTLSHPRLGRYLPATGGNLGLALRLYVWNARLCQEFYIPTQFVEIAFRNCLSSGLNNRFGTNWFNNSSFTSHLPRRLKDELTKSINREITNHGTAMTNHHIVSALSLGFWVHLSSRTPQNIIWRGNFLSNFPNLPANTSQQTVHSKINKLRKFRNRIAHHNAIFDKRPMSQYQNMQDILSWICPSTLWFMQTTANPALIINQRPT